ncbi:protein export chaperone SecB [Alkalidesulfovibrio alkalitolerans DSM 16529]|jgi:preprotein translocase subunit SecB|uniref:Protein export chaperone SecB n=1 Tax=Alkalidesulfovibrio alkalitolerans DSM 16529 TaxID=1121439 RepID=S7TD18_9BACT|nr:protein-export chaperone SecB [Alkalidesulfovibrio alkalitolerans]EPR35087.1 protein export chaperone SecB [Alkalidesulfovibrio alkalitolerans DSM 16529]
MKNQFELQAIKLREINFRLDDESPPQEVHRGGFSIDLKAAPREGDGRQVRVTMRVHTVGEGFPFSLDVAVSGYFAFLRAPEKEEMRTFLDTYAKHILLPYAREAVSNLMARSGMPPVYLPLVLGEPEADWNQGRYVLPGGMPSGTA